MSIKRVFNFNAGPACLPLEVIEEVQTGFTKFDGMSVLEISHRSKAFEGIMDESRSLITELMGVPKDYHILFLQGGASLQFSMVPMNLMEERADYVITGHWAKRAFEEAKLFGEARTIFSSEGSAFSRLPTSAEIATSEGASYLHITTNNTIYGSQYQAFPDPGATPLIADMSSDIMSRLVDVSKFGLIYASAQKNIGPAGVTLVIIRDELTRVNFRSLPTMLCYSAHVKNVSLYNTPPVFAIYVMQLVLRWMKRSGGIATIERANEEKAKILYDVLDASSFYRAPVEKLCRSRMNVVFTLPDETLTEKFVAQAKERGMVGLKGHRSVGGIRASIYNAFPVEGVKALVEFMREFERAS